MIIKFKQYESYVFKNTVMIFKDNFIPNVELDVHNFSDNKFTIEFIGDLDISEALDTFVYDNNIDEEQLYSADELYEFILYVDEYDLYVDCKDFCEIYKPKKYMKKIKQDKFNL